MSESEEIDEKNTRKLEKALQKYFPYHYKVVLPKEIYGKTKRYSDTSIYRYALVGRSKVSVDPWTLEGELEEGMSFSPGIKRTYTDFAFYSRVDQQQYPFSGNGTSVMKIAVNNVVTRIRKAIALRINENVKSSAALTTYHTQFDVSLTSD